MLSWHVFLESAKDQILGVDTVGQHVSPCVRYEMTYLIIRNIIGSVSCLVEWGMASYFCDILCEMSFPHGARGAFDGESLALQAGTLMGNL
jgi:hypothetical protein